MKKSWVVQSNINRRRIKNKRLLYYLYHIKKLSKRQIAKIFKVHCSTISRTLNRMKIKTKYRLKINKLLLYHFYIKNKFSIDLIAKKFKCSRCVIRRRLKKLSIKIRPFYFYTEKEGNGRWLGGISFEPYPILFNNKLKKFIRQRDKYKCTLCHKRGKHVHHIDYNKKNCKEDNLITLCQKHHLRTNYNRDYWYAYFKYIMENR